MTTLDNYYELLGISPDAEDDAVREAVKSQRRTWVKRQQAPSIEKQREAEDRIRKIDAAETALLDPSRRKEYDRKLAEQASRPPAQAPPAVVTNDWLARAKEFMSRDDAESASYAARQATELQAGNREAWSVRARANFTLGHWQDSIFEYREAIRLQPNPEDQFALGAVFESVQRWPEAISSYQAAASMVPAEPQYQVAIAAVLLRTGHPDQALPILETVNSEHPDVDNFNYFLASAISDNVANYVTILHDGSRVFTSQRQVSQAKHDLTRALSLNFTDAALRTRLSGQLQAADQAVKTAWVFPRLGVGARRMFWIGWLFALYLAFALPSALFPAKSGFGVLFGLVLAGGLVWLFIRLYRAPVWKRDEKRTRNAVTRAGVQ